MIKQYKYDKTFLFKHNDVNTLEHSGIYNVGEPYFDTRLKMRVKITDMNEF